MRGVTCVRIYLLDKLGFQLTRLMRGVTRFTMHEQRHGNAFQLTRLMRGVTESLLTMLSSLSFQLTRLMRGVTEKCYSFRGAKKFQLTRLMRGVTHLHICVRENGISSTHTPHARRDPVSVRT